MRIVLVAPYLPHRHIGHGGGVATYQFALHLARRHDLRVVCFQRGHESGAEEDLRSAGIAVDAVPYGSAEDRGLALLATAMDRATLAVRARLTGNPWVLLKYDRPAMHDAVRAAIDAHDADAVIVEYTFLATYAKTARETFAARGRPGHVVLNTHDAGTLARLRRALHSEGGARRAAARELLDWGRAELRGLAWCDTATCVSRQDQQFFFSLTGFPHLRWMPLGVAREACPAVVPASSPTPRLLFVGAFHHRPNRDALEILLSDILPAVRRARPDVVLDVVGPAMPDPLARRAAALGDAVSVHGFVEDLEPFYRDAWIFTAPLFSGGGIKIKILEAAARGCAVVTTPIGMDGIELSADAVWVEGDAAATAQRIASLLGEPDRLRAAGARAREQILARYEWTAIVDDLTAHLESVRG